MKRSIILARSVSLAACAPKSEAPPEKIVTPVRVHVVEERTQLLTLLLVPRIVRWEDKAH
jgi:hypothetical protein